MCKLIVAFRGAKYSLIIYSLKRQSLTNIYDQLFPCYDSTFTWKPDTVPGFFSLDVDTVKQIFLVLFSTEMFLKLNYYIYENSTFPYA